MHYPLLVENDIRTVCTDLSESAPLIINELVSIDHSNNCAINTKNDSSFDEHSDFMIVRFSFFPLNWIGALTLSLLLKLPKKIEVLITCIIFLFSGVPLYFYKSII